MQPGQTLQPGQEDPKETAQPQEQQQANNEADSPNRQYIEQEQNTQEQSFVYTGQAQRDDRDQNGVEEISWQASEYISHSKNTNWYLGLGFVGFMLIGGLYLLLGDILSSVVIALGLAAFAVYGSRKPGVLQYHVDESGVMIGDKQYSFDQFRSFAVSQDHGIPTIILYPTHRFLPPLSLYCAPEDFDQIGNTIAAFLPETEHKPDLIEKTMSRLRF